MEWNERREEGKLRLPTSNGDGVDLDLDAE